ncbi:MAG: hypothetical protein KKH44_03820, partial [Bacteroidetes bacterium]|nr:hypothetical protein [Bacteroidota bacterium]
NGCFEMNKLCDKNIDAIQFLENPELLESKQKLQYDYSNLKVIYNSSLTQKIYDKIQVKTKNPSVRHFNLIPASNVANKPFEDRSIHMAYFVSNTSRKIKNSDLALRLFQHRPDLNKVAIGRESGFFKNIENTAIEELVAQEDLYDLMNDVRLVIIPSFYDSSPGIMTEAISRGCNVLVSKNIGWHEHLNETSVVRNFNDFDEWCIRVNHLTIHEESNNDFARIFKDSPSEILSLFQNLTD